MEKLVESEHRTTVVRRPEVGNRPFATVVLDVDAGITGIDGIEWLAARRGGSATREIIALANQARTGAISPALAYRERLAAIRPHRDDMDALSRAYVEAIVPSGAETIARLRRAGMRVVIVSHGPVNAMYRLGYRLGFEADDVHAVNIRFDALGAYAGFDHTSRLATVGDRSVVIDDLDIERPLLVVGDGPTEQRMDSFEHLASIALP
jgi:phosphoserine phosphatase